MKKLLFILPFILLLSCSVQKRKYQKGFYVSNLKHKKQEQNKSVSHPKTASGDLTLKANSIQSEGTEVEIISASAGNTVPAIIPSNFKLINNNPDSLCDKIVLRNGDEQMIKVLEITPNDVKYKKCDLPDGPMYVAKRADVFMITYANGTKEVFKSESTPAQNTSSTQKDQNYSGPRKTHPMAILALVFCVLGFFTYGLFSIFSVLAARSAERKIRANPKVYGGEMLAKVSRIISTVILSIIASIMLILIIALILSLLLA